jgi:alpha-L-fucosidase
MKKNYLFFLLLIVFAGACTKTKTGDTQTLNDDIEKSDLSNVEAFFHSHEQSEIQLPVETEEEYNQRMQWWKDAKYGMFIHWGLYSYLAGEYKGEITPRIAEWIQNTLKIPLSEYRQIVKEFNPDQFDADAWVSLAKAAGMKYMVLTSKHHDGFALFDSKVSEYDIMSTPYNKDIVRQLKESCHKQGLKFGLYYSHIIDWDHPHAFTGDEEKLRNRMNIVDYNPEDMDRSIFLKEKSFPQLREILSNYGQLDILWYDMGGGLTNDEIRQFVKITRELQPDIIISSRLGGEVDASKLKREMLFDFYTPSDNYYTGDDLAMPWEMCGTTNGSWGFRKDDYEWRSAEFIASSLISTASRNGNYLLNVGPDASGIIPKEAADNLREAGKWISKNSDAIFETSGSPFPWNFEWGYVTQKPGKLYLHVFNRPASNQLELNGLMSDVTKVNILNGSNLKYQQDGRYLTINLKGIVKDDIATVVEVQYKCELRVAPIIAQSLNQNIQLDRIAGRYDKDELVTSWTFEVNQPGKYEIQLISNEKGRHSKPVWEGSEQKGSIEVAGKIIPVELIRDGEKTNPTLFFYKEITSSVGSIEFPRKGTYSLHLKGFEIGAGKWTKGLGLSRVSLIPQTK